MPADAPSRSVRPAVILSHLAILPTGDVCRLANACLRLGIHWVDVAGAACRAGDPLPPSCTAFPLAADAPDYMGAAVRSRPFLWPLIPSYTRRARIVFPEPEVRRCCGGHCLGLPSVALLEAPALRLENAHLCAGVCNCALCEMGAWAGCPALGSPPAAVRRACKPPFQQRAVTLCEALAASAVARTNAWATHTLCCCVCAREPLCISPCCRLTLVPMASVAVLASVHTSRSTECGNFAGGPDPVVEWTWRHVEHPLVQI